LLGCSAHTLGGEWEATSVSSSLPLLGLYRKNKSAFTAWNQNLTLLSNSLQQRSSPHIRRAGSWRDVLIHVTALTDWEEVRKDLGDFLENSAELAFLNAEAMNDHLYSLICNFSNPAEGQCSKLCMESQMIKWTFGLLVSQAVVVLGGVWFMLSHAGK
jgi:hypothetical protein